MKTSRDIILDRLRAAKPWLPPASPLPEAPEAPAGDLLAIFTAAAKAVDAQVDRFDDRDQAMQALEQRIAGQSLLRWDQAHLPVGAAKAADQAASMVFQGDEAERLTAGVGLTACHAALAATGSLVLIAGPGCPREASLVVDRHLVLLDPSQILPDLNAVMARLSGKAHINIITGPSRTADIEMTLTKGVHGPRELEILVAPWLSNGGKP